ncbi:MAG: MOSC N-terminal beta barrel domain-containing protein [Pseudomonadota bacterium]
MSLRIGACFIYPLKAGSALEVDGFELTARGPQNDRTWMIVRDGSHQRGRFVSQRDRGCEKLSTVTALPLDDAGCVFENTLGDSIHITDAALTIREEPADLWGEKCRVLDAGEEAARWFSDYLGLPCRLVKMDERFTRSADPTVAQADDQVSLADSLPLLITSQASLDSLNRMLGPQAVGMDRFRPNLVLEGCAAFEEDVIQTIQVGETVIELALPCARCKVPTINQHTGVVESNEPIATLLATRRGIDPSLKGTFFGQNAIPRSLGNIRTGDSVEVVSYKPMHPTLAEATLRYEPT